MATHSSILAWSIPWTEEPGRLYSPQGHKESDMTERLQSINQSINSCFTMCQFQLYSKMNWPHMYIYRTLLDFLSTLVTTEHGVEFPMLYSRFLLVIQFMHNVSSVYVSIPIYQFLPPPPTSGLVFDMPFFLAHIPCKKLKVSFFHCIHDTFYPFLKREFSS